MFSNCIKYNNAPPEPESIDYRKEAQRQREKFRTICRNAADQIEARMNHELEVTQTSSDMKRNNVKPSRNGKAVPFPAVKKRKQLSSSSVSRPYRKKLKTGPRCQVIENSFRGVTSVNPGNKIGSNIISRKVLGSKEVRL